MAYRDNNTIPGNFTLTNSTSATALVLNARNLDTNSASTSNLQAVTVNASAADSWITVGEEATGNYAFGRDDSDSGKLKITFDASTPTPSDTDVFWSCTTAGEITKPVQPAFLVQLAGNANNVVGNSASPYTVLFDTEVFDQGGDYGSSTFTAPITGRYFFTTGLRIEQLTAAMTNGDARIVTSNRILVCMELSVGPARTVAEFADFACMVGSALMDMDAADTATAAVHINGGAGATADVTGGGTGGSWFSGVLQC